MKPVSTLGRTRRWLLWIGAATALIAAHPVSVQAQSFQAYPISNIRAEDAAARLRTMLDGTDGAEVLADPSGARLLVRGPQGTQELASQLLQTIDRPVRVAQAAARPAAPIVRGYDVGGGDLESIAAQLRRDFATESGIRIATDARTRQVIVVAPPAVQDRVAQRFRSAAPAPAAVNNTPIPNSTPGTPPHTLKNITWQELESRVRQIAGGRMRVVPDGGNQTLSLSIPTENGFQTVMQINQGTGQVAFYGDRPDIWSRAVKVLDQAAPEDNSQTQVVSLQNADPTDIQDAVDALSARSDDSGSAMRTPPKWGGRLVSRIFQDVSQPGGAPGGGGAQGGQQAPAGAESGGLIGSVQIEYLEGLDVIIIRGRPGDVERVQSIIDEIEQLSAETQPVVEVYLLDHVNGVVLATLINELYEEIFSARQGQVSIRAVVNPNAVLLIGREESVAVIKDLISKLDQPAHPASQFQIFRLKHVSAVDAEQTVREFFVDRPGEGTEPRAGIGVQVQVLADYRSNALIVQAAPRDLQEVKRLVESIDVNDTGNLAELRVFRLRNALAEDLATVLQTAIVGRIDSAAGGQGGGAGGTTQVQSSLPSATLQFIDGEGGRLLRSGILADAQVTADPNINALVVRAPADSMELFEALIKELDQLPNAEARIKVFTIANGDATSLAAMMQQLFGQQVTIGQGNAQFAFGALGQTPQLANATASDTSLVPLRFAVDVRTNSIIASASDADLRVVEAILIRLDEGDVATRRLQVVRLKNAPAESVANSITSFLTSQRTLIQQQLLFNQAISPFEQIEREVIVVPELVTNSLIVSATPRYFDEIIQVIKDLDFRPKMVMVQVLIAEIVLSDEFEFGVELGLQDSLLFDRGIALDMGAIPPNAAGNPGFNFNNITQPLPNLNSLGRDVLASQGLTNFGVGRTNGGLVLSAASESVNVLIRALQEQGQAQVLARPQVMTLNNQTAFVQVGQNVARINGSTLSQGILQNQIDDVQTGLLLSLTPLINDDGVVVMSISSERSRLGADADGTVVAFDQNGQAIRSPPIDLTTAQTVVSAKSGQTVVFAGLITSDKMMTLRRVPWLADIPVLGRLFEYEVSQDRRSELLIIMTPHIIESDEDYEWVKAMESERMSWCLADIVNLHGDVGLQANNPLFCCDNLPVIYPHGNPMGFETQPVPIEGMEPAMEFSGNATEAPVVTGAAHDPQAVGGNRTTFNVPRLIGNPGYQPTVTYGPVPPGSAVPPYGQMGQGPQPQGDPNRTAERVQRLPVPVR